MSASGILAGEIAVAQPMSSTQFVGADGVPQAPAVAAGHVPKRSLTCRGVEHTIEQTQPAYVNQMLVNMGYAPAPSQPSPTPSSSEVESSSFPAAPISAPSPAGARPLRYWQPPTADPDDESRNRGGFGLKLDDWTPPAPPKGEETPPAEALITVVTKESPNRDVVRIGDRLVSIDGKPVAGGHAAAVPLLMAAAEAHNGVVPCVVRRPRLLACPGCKKFSVCDKCVGEGRLAAVKQGVGCARVVGVG